MGLTIKTYVAITEYELMECPCWDLGFVEIQPFQRLQISQNNFHISTFRRYLRKSLSCVQVE